AVRADGRMMVVWDEFALNEVWGRILEQDGTPLGPDFRVAFFGSLSEDVIAVPDGFVVAWTGGDSVRLRLFDVQGRPAGPEVDAEAATGFFPTGPFNTFLSLALFPSGDLALVWSFNNRGFNPALTFTGVHGRVIPAGALSEPERWTKFEHARERFVY